MSRASESPGSEGASASPAARPSRWIGVRRRFALVVLGLTFLLVAFGALTTVARTRQFEARRDEMKQLPGSATDRVLREADAHALALGAFREVLAANGGRFAVEFGPDIPASDRRTILLVSGATFLPATGVAQRVDADFLVTFGRVPTSSRVGFTGVAKVDDGWLGRRTG